MLHASLQVVTPPVIKSSQGITKGIHDCESKVTAVKFQYNEEVGEKLKLAILVGMLPKDYQDMVMQKSSMKKELGYEETRDYIMGVANQKVQMHKPTPMELGNVPKEGSPEGNQGNDDWGS